ncbi:MAG TPA: OmpA family protein [Candidatus Limnocylindria bacterium]|nr:OmpA family protein [Candidatus Limnocylindria bacterium]
MRKPLVISVAALVVLLASQPLGAEPVGSHFGLTPFGGFTIFDGDGYAGSGSLTDDLYVGARLGYQMNSWLGLELAGGFTPTAQDIPAGEDVDFYHGSLNVMLTPWSGRYGGPFVFVGGGASQLKPSGGGDALDQGNVEFGGGVRLWLTDVIGLRLEARNLSWLPKDDVTSPLTSTIVLGGGLTFALGARPRDTDGDGVPDRKDQCPDTPKGATVNTDGCPADSDGDGVFDGIDQCANTPKGATVDVRGCPSDADQDGVYDGVDQCADTPKGATVDARGCPVDTDKDGVFDGVDQCEGTPAGCQVDERGCPKDADNDGVCDGVDKCPDTGPGLRVEADGCPIQVIDRETELLDTGMIRLSDVNFETAKADIMPESFGSLDGVGAVLGKWPELRMEIGGHTDSRGSNAYNQRLSEARAKSVLAYLTNKFPNLKADQFSVRGYGESRPLVPNTNTLNMSKNRRVEFVVQNKDVLKREVERRRLLQKGDAPRPAPTTPPTTPVQPPPAAPDTTQSTPSEPDTTRN